MYEFRSLTDEPVELREDESGRPLIRGYAAVFNSLSHNLGGFVERIMPGAFDRTLREVAEGKRVVAMRVQHEGGLTTVGTTANGSLRLSVNKRGLLYESLTLPDTTAARDLLELIRGGYITKSSFAFSVPSRDGERWLLDKAPAIRELLDVDLYDVAPVDGPAYEASSVSARVAVFNEAIRNVAKFKKTRTHHLTLFR